MSYWAHFPWRLFFRYWLIQVICFNLLFLGLITLLEYRYSLPAFIYNEGLLNFFVLSAFISLGTSLHFTRPLWRLIRRALAYSSPILMDRFEIEEDLLTEEQGEFSELEFALHRLYKKMRKKREQLFREREENQAFMSSVQEGLLSMNLDQKLLYYNSQFAAQFVNPEDLQKKNLTFKEIFRVPELIEGFDKALKFGQAERLTVRLPTLTDKQVRYFAISINPLRKVRSREIYGAIGIFHDITELKKTEQVRIDFVGNASHELRTPLTSLKGYVETLKMDIEAGEYSQAKKFIQIISSNVDRLIDLVNDLLSLSALESNSDLRLDTVYPLAVSDLVIGDLTPLAQSKQIELSIEGKVAPFSGDARKVEQVVRNLVGNAIKYIPQGKKVTVVWEEGPEGLVVLRVKDNGPGIAPEHHDRLFERFYRIDKGRTRDAGGTGIGLAIVKHIVHSHGGSVRVVSAPDQGAEFICSFPRRGKLG